jgi:hypothetical protein
MKEIDHPDPDIFRMYIPDIAAFTEEGYKTWGNHHLHGKDQARG